MTIEMSQVAWMQVWKLLPEERRETRRFEIRDRDVIQHLLTAISSAERSECYIEDFGAPRYFIRLFGEEAVLLDGLEIQPEYAYVRDEWKFTPDSEAWKVLEQMAAA